MIINVQHEYAKTQSLSLRKEVMVRANEKELLQQKRRFKARCIGRSNPGKCICECSCERYRRIGKGCGSRKPVGAGDVKTDGKGDCLGTQTSTAPNGTQQPEGCDNAHPIVRDYGGTKWFVRDFKRGTEKATNQPGPRGILGDVRQNRPRC